jgi:type II secretory pathway component GspD/PulD (secretin)
MIHGVVIPGRVTQRIHTSVEMASGQTVAIGGLLAGNGANNRESLILVKAELVQPETKEAALARKLASHISFHFVDQPLNRVLEDLQTWHGINIVPDKVALDEAGMTLDAPISLRFEDVSLRTALRMILGDAGLGYVVRDGTLVVTTRNAARGRPVERVYSVADLVNPKLLARSSLNGTRWTDLAEQLIAMIEKTTDPTSWRTLGGQGVISYVPLANAIIVRQTPDVQEQIVDLLSAVRRLKDASPSGDAEEAEPIPAPQSERDHPKPSASLRRSLPPIDGGIVGAMQTLYLDHVEKEKAHLTLTVIESSSQPATPTSSRK